jgi:hypothetical protein
MRKLTERQQAVMNLAHRSELPVWVGGLDLSLLVKGTTEQNKMLQALAAKQLIEIDYIPTDNGKTLAITALK